jgi:hypothetical protein
MNQSLIGQTRSGAFSFAQNGGKPTATYRMNALAAAATGPIQP